MVGKPSVGTDLRALSYEECVILASDIKESLEFWKDTAMVNHLTRNLEIVEDYISRTYKEPLSHAQGPLSPHEAKMV